MYCSAVLLCRWQRRISFALVLALLAFVSGCAREELSHYQRKQLAVKETVEYLQALGSKVDQKSYPLVSGKGKVATHVVVLSGVQKIDEEVFRRLKFLGRITELDLSKTNVSDAHLERLNDKEISGMLLTLNLSHTNVTDQGLDKLTNLPMLSTLILTSTRTTPANDEPLRKRLMVGRRAATSLFPDFPKQLTIQR